MATDVTVNLKQMQNKAESISNRGVNLGKKFENMLGDVKNMQKYWQGDAYRDFVKIVNDTIPTLKKMNKYFAVKLPKEIVAKRNQYAKAMKKATIATTTVNLSDLQIITIPDQGDEIKFQSAGMNAQTSKIDQRFQNILVTNLPNIKEDFNAITWKGSTGDALKKEFKKYMDETIEAVKKVKKSFRDALEAQAEAMEKAEKFNLVTEIGNVLGTIDKEIIDPAQKMAKDVTETLKDKIYDWKSEL